MNKNLTLKTRIIYGVAILTFGLTIGYLAGALATFLSRLIGFFTTEEQYEMIIPAFLIIGFIMGVIAAIQGPKATNKTQ